MEIIDVIGTKVKCIHVPGHTKGGVCYYFADYGWLISGDTLFQMSIGRTDFPTGNLNDLLTAIREKLFITPTMDKVRYPVIHHQRRSRGKADAIRFCNRL